MNIMLTVAEAAELARMSPGAVRRLCIEGQLPHIRVGTKRLVNQTVFETFLLGTTEMSSIPEESNCAIRRID